MNEQANEQAHGPTDLKSLHWFHRPESSLLAFAPTSYPLISLADENFILS